MGETPLDSTAGNGSAASGGTSAGATASGQNAGGHSGVSGALGASAGGGTGATASASGGANASLPVGAGMGAGANGGAGASTESGQPDGNSGAMAGARAPETAVCGDGKVSAGETCDPKSDCPTLESCRTADPCLQPKLLGSAETCDAKCDHDEITACTAGDKCCPKTCNNASDSDCSVSCGDGVTTGNETCEANDPQKACPTSCDDNEPCTKDTQTGTPAQCNVVCTHVPITQPSNGDHCCPKSANAGNDDDCATRCGDGAVTGNETCDPMSTSACPTESSCRSEGCSGAKYSGSPSDCTAKCEHAMITARTGGDGCCPPNATIGDDPDCKVRCGDGVISAGETCDPPSSCPTMGSCGNNGCDGGKYSGNPSSCTAKCDRAPITARVNGDGCCPPNATIANDSDCDPRCGDGVMSAGETCDPPSSCPTSSSCHKNNSCDDARFSGNTANCTAKCDHNKVTVRVPNDGCCPDGADLKSDGDCPVACGDGVISQGETCDPGSESTRKCPSKAACIAGNCQTATFTGSECTSVCNIIDNPPNECGGCAPAPGKVGEPCRLGTGTDSCSMGTYQCRPSTLEVYCQIFC